VTEDEDFRDLIRRVRAGDQSAAAELMQRYEPEIRRTIRVRLGSSRLNRVLDSVDVCQSVMGNVFVRIAAGQFDVEHPAQLIGLLLKMASNKLADHARKPANRAVPAGDSTLDARAGRRDPPDPAFVVRDLVSEVRRRMTGEERRIAELRAAGHGWDEIGRRLKDSPDALRKRLDRAADRIAKELGLDEVV
jgi:DNA-directed RNA polymerase specialized sigma24 family protein